MSQIMYVIFSNREGVTLHKRLIDKITEGSRTQTYYDGDWSEWRSSKRYHMKDSPYEIDFQQNQQYVLESCYASGEGDLWSWSYICTLDKKLAQQLYKKEELRVKEKYKKQINMYDEFYIADNNEPNNQDEDMVKLINLYDNINDMLCSGKFDEVDKLISEIELNRLPTLLQVGLLRITYPAKSNLKNWHSTRGRVRDILVQQRRKIDKILKGLYHKDELE